MNNKGGANSWLSDEGGGRSRGSQSKDTVGSKIPAGGGCHLRFEPVVSYVERDGHHRIMGSSGGKRVATPSWIQSVRSRSAGQDGEERDGERAWESRVGGDGVHGDLVREPRGVERIEERDLRTRVLA